MQIQRERFLALTATLAGFWPNAGCTLSIHNDTATTASTGTAGTGTAGTGTGASSGGSSGAGSTGALTSGPTGGTTAATELECCEVNLYPGCLDDTVEACVCAEDPYCCGLEGGVWDLTCVNLVGALGCGFCEISGTAGGSSTFG